MSAIETQRRAHGIAALVAAIERRARHRLLFGIDGEDAVADRKTFRDRNVHQRARRLARHDIVVAGLAANDAAERDSAVVRLARRFGRVARDDDRGRNFERARDIDPFGGRPGLAERRLAPSHKASPITS